MSATALAQAIVDWLNDPARNFSITFRAERRAIPIERAEELATVKVSVFAGTTKAERISRAEFQKTFRPVVAIQKRVMAASESQRLEEYDNLIALVDEIQNALINDYTGYSFVGFDNEQERDSYAVQALREHGCFATAIVLEYAEA